MNASEEMLDRAERTAGRLRKELEKKEFLLGETLDQLRFEQAEAAEKGKRIEELERDLFNILNEDGHIITTEQIDEIFALCRCRCDECWTARDMHSPDCRYEVLEELNIVACEECGGSGRLPRITADGPDTCKCSEESGGRCHGHGWKVVSDD